MATERNTPPEPQQSNFERPPKKSLAPWVLLLPLALLAGVLWQSWRQPEQPVQPLVQNGITPKPRVKPTTVAAKPKPTEAKRNVPSKLTIFLPDDNAVLQRQIIDNSFGEYSSSARNDYELVANMSLDLLEKKAPDMFPQGSFIGSVRREGDLVKVDLKKSWYEMPQWNRGEMLSMVAQDAIVNTLAAAEQKNPKAIKVQFLQDGKPATTLGQLDLSEPLSPNMDLVAKS